MRVALLSAAVAIASVTSVAAQDITAAQRDACKADYVKFCNGTIPGGGRIIACLGKVEAKLSEACKKVLAEAKK
ncbi:MAG: hypothetical protein Q8M26_14840 [Pseudolabrys sp.]|nr:hypothetical protein [Pseudolabrys sp.]